MPLLESPQSERENLCDIARMSCRAYRDIQRNDTAFLNMVSLTLCARFSIPLRYTRNDKKIILPNCQRKRLPARKFYQKSVAALLHVCHKHILYNRLDLFQKAIRIYYFPFDLCVYIFHNNSPNISFKLKQFYFTVCNCKMSSEWS